MSRILFTDLDGTLLDDQKQISAGNRAAIRKWLSEGRQIVISTGRPLPSAVQLARQLHLTTEGCYLIASNGALLYDCCQNRILFETGLDRTYVRYLLDEAASWGIHAHSYSKTNVLCEHRTPELAYYEQAINVPAQIVPNITEYLTYDPWKVILIDRKSKARLQKFQSAHAEWAQGKADSIFSCDFMLEYCPPGISKGNAVQSLCSLLRIPLSEAIAVGDAENDISMIQAAGIGVAMANASEEVRRAAGYVTEADCNHDGVAEILNKFSGGTLE